MGINCEIKLLDGDAYVPGSKVSGVLRYTLEEETSFRQITLSLKGKGNLLMKTKRVPRKGNWRGNHNLDVYVDIDNILHRETNLQPASYEVNFNFKLPEKIPPTLKLSRQTKQHNVDCKIMYYVRIKFDMSSFFKRNKHYRKEILVFPIITPILSVEPVICGQSKELMHLFSNKKSVVNIKAQIERLVYKPGDTIRSHYEATNNTEVTIRSIEHKLVEVYMFKPGLKIIEIENEEKVPLTVTKTGPVNSGESESNAIEIKIPSELHCIEHSNVVSRYYEVQIEADLPTPHRNVTLKIPLQVGETEMDLPKKEKTVSWEVMSDENVWGKYRV